MLPVLVTRRIRPESRSATSAVRPAPGMNAMPHGTARSLATVRATATSCLVPGAAPGAWLSLGAGLLTGNGSWTGPAARSS